MNEKRTDTVHTLNQMTEPVETSWTDIILTKIHPILKFVVSGERVKNSFWTAK